MAWNAALLLLAVGAAASPAVERDGKITLENFGRAAHEWQELNDPVMGGQSVATFGIAGGVGVFNGTCAIVPSLSAPGFCSAQTKQKLFGDSWPDASAALAGGLVLVARSLTPSFAGFKVAFGAKDVPSASRYTPQGTFKAPFNVTGVAGDDGFEEIYVPFSSFSWDWSPFTGLRRRPAISAGKNDETPRDRTNRRPLRHEGPDGRAAPLLRGRRQVLPDRGLPQDAHVPGALGRGRRGQLPPRGQVDRRERRRVGDRGGAPDSKRAVMDRPGARRDEEKEKLSRTG